LNNAAANEWIRNATKLWGNPAHPLGEVSILDFYMMASNSIEDQRNQWFGSKTQIITIPVLSFIILRNFIISFKMVIARPYILVSWCCLVPTVLGILTGLMIMLMELGSVFNCRHTIWFIGFGISISYFCNSLILLQKAYLIFDRQKWVAYVGIPLTLSHLVYGFLIVFYSFSLLTADSGCVFNYPPFFLWYWFGTAVLINLLFSSIFYYVALQQYRQYGLDAWKRLARDGIQAMCLAVLCNIICCICIIFHIVGGNTDLLFLADWVLVSTILIRHCRTVKSKTSSFASRKRYHMANTL
ncbi:hypothetical protein BDF19DRAFT_456083, partial [Syncephalis fuscata]